MVRPIDAEALKEKMTVSALGGHKRIWVCGVIDDAPTAEPQSAWIPCNERLPKCKEPVLICIYNSEMVVATLDDDKIGFSTDDTWTHRKYVTHWMPLPEPPKEEE